MYAKTTYNTLVNKYMYHVLHVIMILCNFILQFYQALLSESEMSLFVPKCQ